MESLNNPSPNTETQTKTSGLLPRPAHEMTWIEPLDQRHAQYERNKYLHEVELRLSLMVIAFALSAPAIFVTMMQAGAHFWFAAPMPFLLLLLSAHFQGKRILLSKKLKPEIRKLPLGAIVQSRLERENFVITRVGVKHYYLCAMGSQQERLVSFRVMADRYFVIESQVPDKRQ